jgi:type III restriction enzyme
MVENENIIDLINSSQKLGLLKEIKIPQFITTNIKHNLRDYQIDAIKKFIYYNESSNMEQYKIIPIHLLFNMATGSGKTLIMACLILYYYKLGYRKFLFFVNQKNIVNKTEDNLFNKHTTKYLFKENIIINDKNINIKKVENFSKDNLNIEIIFTTIHQIHTDFYTIKENKASELDYKNNKIVMLSDECHHLNSLTKKGQKSKIGQTENKSWENTIINKILKVENNENILLEFTATIPNEEAVLKKYDDKKIVDLDLKKFVKQKYTKEVNLLYGDFDKKQKILISLLLNFTREKISQKNNFYLKPVILFKSKLIEESRKDFLFFLNIIENIKEEDFKFIKIIFNSRELNFNLNDNSIFLKINSFLENNNIKFNEIINFIKHNFQKKYCIITNSEDKKSIKKEELSQNKEKLLNTLEDKDNKIRAIFTVNRLCEGWDVLNLFDIVRLYEGQNTGGGNKGKSGKTTIQEVQLIGRGVRYFPFKYDNYEDYKRKFDEDLKNELRIVEEFFYISDKDHRYIADLRNELLRQGLLDTAVRKIIKLKDNFKKSSFFKMNKILKNERIDNPNKRKNTFEEILKNLKLDFKYLVKEVEEEDVFENKIKTKINSYQKNKKFRIINYKNIFYKALSIKSSFYNFKDLKKYLNINSIDDLFNEKFLKEFEINIRTDNYISNEKLLEFFCIFLEKMKVKLKEEYEPYNGSKFEFYNFKEIFDIEKEILVKDTSIKYEYLGIIDKMKKEKYFIYDDFIFDSGYEASLVKFIDGYISKLKEKYKEVYLIRNYETYKIYNFSNGVGFAPDFLLFLIDDKNPIYYQIFIEAKGENLEIVDGWKADLLKKIEKEGKQILKTEILDFETDKWKLIGLPFWLNSPNKKDFRNQFEKKLNIKKEIKEFNFKENKT